MPNHCGNNAIIEGPEADIKRFWEAIQGDEELRFTNLVPKPEDVEDWYTWCNDNWGTKWGDYDHYGELCDGEWEDKAIHSSYITAWGPLSDDFWIKVSTMFPTLRIAVTHEEPGLDFSGYDSFYGGEHVGEFRTEYSNLMAGAIRDLRHWCDDVQQKAGLKVSAEIMKEVS